VSHNIGRWTFEYSAFILFILNLLEVIFMKRWSLLILPVIAIILVIFHWWRNIDNDLDATVINTITNPQSESQASFFPEESETAITAADLESVLKEVFKESPQIGIKQRNQSTQFQKRFIKISDEGERLDSVAKDWKCAESTETGLVWEVKQFDGGLQDNDNKYTWYSSADNSLATGFGKRDGGSCFFSSCDSEDYVRMVNEAGLCGGRNWRLPIFSELETLLDRDYYDPVINHNIFIHAKPGNYMTSTELETNPAMMMVIDFFNGISFAGRKDLSYYIRLVRSL